MDHTDFNGIESYVYDMSRPGTNTVTEWFPKGDSLSYIRWRSDKNKIEEGENSGKIIEEVFDLSKPLKAKLEKQLSQIHD